MILVLIPRIINAPRFKQICSHMFKYKLTLKSLFMKSAKWYSIYWPKTMQNETTISFTEQAHCNRLPNLNWTDWKLYERRMQKFFQFFVLVTLNESRGQPNWYQNSVVISFDYKSCVIGMSFDILTCANIASNFIQINREVCKIMYTGFTFWHPCNIEWMVKVIHTNI